MKDPHKHDPDIPPAMDEVRDLTDEEYHRTYATGSGGHPLPSEVLAEMTGHDDPEAVAGTLMGDDGKPFILDQSRLGGSQ